MKTVKNEIITFLAFICSLLIAQTPSEQLKPDARITLVDNTVIELSDFQIHRRHKMPSSWTKGDIEQYMKIPLKQGNLWHLLSFNDIEKITFTHNENLNGWLISEINLLSGQLLRGETPTIPELMWRNGSDIKITGNDNVPGNIKYEASLKNIKEIIRYSNEPDVFILTTIDGERKSLTSPNLKSCSYVKYHNGQMRRDVTFSKYNENSNITYRTKDNNKLVNVKLGEIDSIVFKLENGGSLGMIKMKYGDEINCFIGPELNDFYRVKGNTISGLIWYGDVRRNGEYFIKSIKFL